MSTIFEGAQNSPCKIYLVLSCDMLASSGPQIIHQRTLAHVLRHEVNVLLIKDQTDKLNQIFVFEGSKIIFKNLRIYFKKY